MSKMKFGWRLAGASALACAGFVGFSGISASAANFTHGPPSTLMEPTPEGLMPAFPTVPVPPPAVPGNCPFVGTEVFISFVPGEGNGVVHGTSNNNGDWGGATGEGPGVLTDGEGNVLYSGHLTEWGGGGNNAQLQNEGGFTLSFTGTGADGAITVNANQHSTTNAKGVPTSNLFNVAIVCTPPVS